MEPRGSSVSPLRMRRRITTSAPEQDHSRSGASIGRAECREKKIGIEPKGSFFFLTFPLIGLCYEASPYLVDSKVGPIGERFEVRADGKARHPGTIVGAWQQRAFFDNLARPGQFPMARRIFLLKWHYCHTGNIMRPCRYGIELGDGCRVERAQAA